MKKLFLVLALVGCASVPAQKSALMFSSELKNVSDDATGVVTKPNPNCPPTKPPVPVPTPPPGKLIGLAAVTDDPYLGWVKTSVGFSKGEVTEDKLQGLGTPGLPYAWRVIKRWPSDGSVRIGQIKTVGFFQNKAIQPVMLEWGQTPKPFFTWHAAVKEALDANKFATELRVEAIVNGQPVSCQPVSGHYKFLVTDASEITARFRSHCVNKSTLESHPLSMTAYVTTMADDPLVRMTHVLGNDTRELAVGQMNLENVQVLSGSLPRFRWVNEASYGTKSTILADGQTMAFKTVMTFDPNFETSSMHVATGEPMGFQFWDNAKASGAFGTAPLPKTRITAETLNVAHNEVDTGAQFPEASASQHLGLVNKRPPDAGAQPAFTSTMHLENQRAMQGYSARKMAANLLALYRESYRPVFVWETRDGVEDRVSAVNYPELFCWNNRCPHYDFSWLSQYPEWFSRTRNAGFNGGSTSGWESHDFQHVALRPIIDGYELTGSDYLKDILQFYVSLFRLGYFSDAWVGHIEADRAFGRGVRDAIALIELFPEMPESLMLKDRIPQKLAAYRAAVDSSIAKFGTPEAVPFDANDPRVVSGQWGPAQNAFGQGSFVGVGWMQGFVNEAMTLLPDPDLRLLAAAETYYTPDGVLKTYFQLPFPDVFVTGGIGVEWQSGWLQLANRYPQAEGSKFIIEKVKPHLDARMRHGCGFPSQFFCLNDSWFAW